MIIGILSAIALPLFANYQLRSKTAEGKVNLAAIRISEAAYYSEFEVYLAVAPEPAVIPGSQAVAFDGAGSGFAPLGFETDGRVYFSYGVVVSADRVGYTADAGADIDTDGIVQFWGYTKPDAAGNVIDGAVGCPAAGLAVTQVGPCGPTYGNSVF